MSIFNCTCNNAIHGVFPNSYLISTPCCRRAPHACPLSPCATHLPNRRPPACMWLWTVCQRPALLPPVTMLRTLSLRLGPAPVLEQAPPPPSLAPGEGPAPPCPPLSMAPLGRNSGVDRIQRNTDRQRGEDTKRRETERERERGRGRER